MKIRRDVALATDANGDRPHETTGSLTMPTVLDTLKEIDQLQRELTDAREQLQRGPLQLKGRQKELEKKQEGFEAEKKACQTLRIEADRMELGLKSSESKVRDLKVKLNQAKTNKEYSTLQDEIKNFETANGKTEEQILGFISEYEEKLKQLKVHEQDVQHAKEDFAKFKELLDYKLQKMTDRVGILDGKINELLSQLDKETKDVYVRLHKSRGTAALAACINGVCSNCYTEETLQSQAELKMGHFVLCKNCGAMLYSTLR